MTAENVDVLRRLFQAVEDRDIEPMYEIYAPDVRRAGGTVTSVRW